METKFAIISRLSADNPEMVFNQLMHHFNKENLLSWYHSLKGKAAVGIDGMTKETYDKNLEENLEALLKKLKTMSYIPGPVRQILIPKEGRELQDHWGLAILKIKLFRKECRKYLKLFMNLYFGKAHMGLDPN